MEAENGAESEIWAYAIDFLEHLKSVQKHKEEFMIFYTHWEDLRNSTIKALEELLQRVKTEENITDAGAAAGAASSVVGLVGGVARLCSKRTISPLWTAVAVAGSAIKSGFELAKAAAVSRARKKVANLLERDNQETRSFLRLGLSCDGVIKEMKDTAEKMHAMSWSYSQELLEKETSSAASLLTRGGNGNPLTHREVARCIEEVFKIDIQNVVNVIGKFLEHNPEVERSFRSALQAVPNVSLTRLINTEVVGGFVAGAIFVVVVVPTLRRDCSDFARCIGRLIEGTSETQDTISSILERLKKERQLLQGVYRQLSGTELCSTGLFAQTP